MGTNEKEVTKSVQVPLWKANEETVSKLVTRGCPVQNFLFWPVLSFLRLSARIQTDRERDPYLYG